MELKSGMHTQNCMYGVTSKRIDELEKAIKTLMDRDDVIDESLVRVNRELLKRIQALEQRCAFFEKPRQCWRDKLAQAWRHMMGT